MAQTTTIETITVVRPLKVIAFICGCISVLLLIIALSTSGWLKADGYKQGLWQYCTWADDQPTRCFAIESIAWIRACAALCIISLLFAIVGTVLTGIGLLTNNPERKFLLYKIAMFLVIIAMICVLLSVIIFPIMFMREIQQTGRPKWYFAWSYGLAWGAAIFLTGIAILLFMDKESDEIYYKEKTTYNAGYETDA